MKRAFYHQLNNFEKIRSFDPFSLTIRTYIKRQNERDSGCQAVYFQNDREQRTRDEGAADGQGDGK